MAVNLRRCCQNILAVFTKELIQMKRDRATFAMIIGIPLLQVVLFGYAINTNPRHLPTALCYADLGPFTRTLIRGLENSRYFRVVRLVQTEQIAQVLLATSQVQFVLHLPPHFEQALIRGERPQVLLEEDATDPVATGAANAAIMQLMQTVFQHDLTGALTTLRPTAPSPVQLVIHAKYNPEVITQYHILPGLIGVILTLTMVMITGIAITREYERGTMEHLLATPLAPVEIMLGKMFPYILVGYVQAALIVLAAMVLFAVPIIGSVWLLGFAMAPFIAANLSVGLTISTLARNQLQSVQMTIFFFLPSLLLSGFMFPFYGMPPWAQWLGNLLPLTHFLRIVRGIILKGNGWLMIWPDLWPILVFISIILAVGINRFRRTLD